MSQVSHKFESSIIESWKKKKKSKALLKFRIISTHQI